MKTETQAALVPGQVYYPWVGQHFSTSNPRILFLGHSHYGDEEHDPDPHLTNSVIAGHLERGGLPFFTKLAQLGTGLPAHEIDLQNFFERIAFMNLLQGTLEGPRMAAPSESLARDVAILAMLLKRLKPTHIVMLGNDVWSALNNSGHLLLDLQDEPYRSGSIEKIPAFLCRHPSGGFSSEKWARQLGAFLRDHGVKRDSLEQWVAATRRESPASWLLG